MCGQGRRGGGGGRGAAAPLFPLPDECVDLGALNVVHAVDCCLDLALVGACVDDEDEGVVVLNLLHGRLCVVVAINEEKQVSTHIRCKCSQTGSYKHESYLW